MMTGLVSGAKRKSILRFFAAAKQKSLPQISSLNIDPATFVADSMKFDSTFATMSADCTHVGITVTLFDQTLAETGTQGYGEEGVRVSGISECTELSWQSTGDRIMGD